MNKTALFAAAWLVIPGSFAVRGAADTPSQKLGFLFAVRNPGQIACSEDSCQGHFATRLLIIDGGKMRVVLDTPHLYVPRSTGFWEIGVLAPAPSKPRSAGSAELTEEGELGWQLWAAPIGQKPIAAAASAGSADQGETGTNIRRILLSWIGTSYLSFVEQIGEYTETHAILPIDGVAKNTFDQVWKPAIPEVVYRKDLDSCVDEGSDFNTRSFLEGAEQGWSISRGTLGWQFEWAFGYSSGVARGYGTGCATSLRPPKELVGNDALGIGWNEVLAQVPDALTAFASPDRSIVVVFAGGQVLALKRAGNTLEGPFSRAFLPASDRDVIAAQWAVGKYAESWLEQLSHAKSWTEK